MNPVLQPPPSSPPPKQERAAQQAWAPGGPGCSPRPAAGAAGAQQEQEQQGAQPPSAVPSLLDCCQAALLRSLAPGSVCTVLQVADCLDPMVDGLRRWVIGQCRRNVLHASIFPYSSARSKALHLRCAMPRRVPPQCYSASPVAQPSD